MGWLQSAGHAAHELVTPLGILHGSVDIGVGAYEVVHGLRNSDYRQVRLGALGMAVGGALVAAAAGGGTPALVTAGALIAGKVGYSIYSAPSES
jgi:hypothetical protein